MTTPVNYGLNSVRFVSPVRTGRPLRGRFSLLAAADRSPGVGGTVSPPIDATLEILGCEETLARLARARERWSGAA